MNEDKVVYAHYDSDHGTMKMYVTGFVLSVIFTLAAFALVWAHTSSKHETFSHPFLITTTLVLAVIQFFVQIFFFLHLGRETKPRWKRTVLLLMITFVLVVVVGSIWVMYSLSGRMMPSTEQMIKYMQNQNAGF